MSVAARDEHTEVRKITGRVADIHKPLVSPSQCAKAGQLTYLDESGGWMFSKDSTAGKQVSKILDRESRRPQHGVMPIYEEKGVYNFYFKLGQSGSIAPLEEATTSSAKSKTPDAGELQKLMKEDAGLGKEIADLIAKRKASHQTLLGGQSAAPSISPLNSASGLGAEQDPAAIVAGAPALGYGLMAEEDDFDRMENRMESTAGVEPACQPAEVVVADGDSGIEMQMPVVIRAPYEPTTQEQAEHGATGHVVYRSWCDACLAGKGLGQAHRSAPKDDQETAVAEFISDYGFMGQDDGKCMPLFVLKYTKTKRVAYSVVHAKGLDRYAIKFTAMFLQSTGYRNIVNKSDGEPSIVALKTKMLEQCPLVNAVPREIP